MSKEKSLGEWRKHMLIFICMVVLQGCGMIGQVDDLALPDPLTMEGDRKIQSGDMWQNKRRAEILELFQTHVYGRAPVGRPEKMTFEVLDTNVKALNGAATRKQIRVHLSGDTASLSMDILIFLPNDQPRPVKLFVGLNFMGNHTIHQDKDIIKTDNYTPWGKGDRGSESQSWPVEQVLKRGYGIATIHCADLDPDKFDDFKDGVHGTFDPAHYPKGRSDDAWGTIAAWSWGLSRAMDYFETDSDIEHTRIAVLGHSRLGKAALWCGALDQRFALVISNNSGCTGAALARRKLGEDIFEINKKFPHWFCKNYKIFNGKEEELPIDQHMLIALMAPRPVYVASATKDDWADPEGEFLSCVYAEPVYKLFGLKGLRTKQMPAADNPINTGHIGYHIRTGKHDMTAYDWNCFVDFADNHLGKTKR